MHRFLMMLRRSLAAGFMLVAICISGQAIVGEAAAFDLIDPGEYAASRAEIEAWHDANPVISSTRALQPGPKIRVIQPEGGDQSREIRTRRCNDGNGNWILTP